MQPFVEMQDDQRIHDEQFDRNGLQRDLTGTTGRLGSALNLFGSLTGEMAIGYVDRIYKDVTLPDVSGVIADGALIWQPTGADHLQAERDLASLRNRFRPALPANSAATSTLEVDHAFRSWLIGIGKVGYGNDVYPGAAAHDNR